MMVWLGIKPRESSNAISWPSYVMLQPTYICTGTSMHLQECTSMSALLHTSMSALLCTSRPHFYALSGAHFCALPGAHFYALSSVHFYALSTMHFYALQPHLHICIRTFTHFQHFYALQFRHIGLSRRTFMHFQLTELVRTLCTSIQPGSWECWLFVNWILCIFIQISLL